MKKLTCVILGYGDRSAEYSKYALNYPNELEVIGVIDPVLHKLDTAKKLFNLKDEQLFTNLDDFLDKNIKCDFVINGTMDNLHYSTSIKLLNRKYNMLLEKPITANVKELLEIRDLANKNGCKVIVCHVLRYTPFYLKIKQLIKDGAIGKVSSIQMNEHIWHGHFVNAFVRGKWRSEKECGSGLLLQKCCHDTDLLCWLNADTEPELISSFGSRSLFTPENAPEGSTEYCYNCPKKDECVFDAYDLELKKDFIPQYTWQEINKPLDQITEEDKIEHLKHNIYGKCVYKTDMDIVDRQCVSVQYKNGSIATLNMVGGATIAGRCIHVVGSLGEIVGEIEGNKIVLTKYFSCEKESMLKENAVVYDLNQVNELEQENQSIKGHYGGDELIMKDLIGLLKDGKQTLSTTNINDSVKGHLICYAAEISRRENKIVNIDKEF